MERWLDVNLLRKFQSITFAASLQDDSLEVGRGGTDGKDGSAEKVGVDFLQGLKIVCLDVCFWRALG